MVPDQTNPIARIIDYFAAKLPDAPGRTRLQCLARTSARIPEPLLSDLEKLILQLDDVELVGDDISLSLIDIAFCDARYADATEFAAELRARLARYAREPRVADNARGDFYDRRRWWQMALGRAGELCKWPPLILLEAYNNG